jgi:hypothetical protein
MLAPAEETQAYSINMLKWLAGFAFFFGVVGTVLGAVALSIMQKSSTAAIPDSCTSQQVSVQGICDDSTATPISPQIITWSCKEGRKAFYQVPDFTCAPVNLSSIAGCPLFIKLPPNYRSDAGFGYNPNVRNGVDPHIGVKTTFWNGNAVRQDSQTYIFQDASNTTYLCMGVSANGTAIDPSPGFFGYGPAIGFSYTFMSPVAAPAKMASLLLMAAVGMLTMA